jgi:hypothetical protein
MRSSAAFSWLTGSFGFMRFFSEGTWSARGWRCPTGASESICWSEFIDGAAAGFRGPAGCAIAAEPSTRASNAIVVINFLILGLRVGTPFRTHSEGEARSPSCGKPHIWFRCSNARGARECFSAPLWRIWPSGLYERNCLPLTLIRLDVTTGAASQRIRTISGRWNHLLQQLSHLPCIVTPSPSRLESRCDQLTGLPLDFKLGTPPVDDNANSTQPVDIADN